MRTSGPLTRSHAGTTNVAEPRRPYRHVSGAARRPPSGPGRPRDDLGPRRSSRRSARQVHLKLADREHPEARPAPRTGTGRRGRPPRRRRRAGTSRRGARLLASGPGAGVRRQADRAACASRTAYRIARASRAARRSGLSPAAANTSSTMSREVVSIPSSPAAEWNARPIPPTEIMAPPTDRATPPTMPRRPRWRAHDAPDRPPGTPPSPVAPTGRPVRVRGAVRAGARGDTSVHLRRDVGRQVHPDGLDRPLRRRARSPASHQLGEQREEHETAPPMVCGALVEDHTHHELSITLVQDPGHQRPPRPPQVA